MEQYLVPTMSPKLIVEIKIRVESELLEQFDLIRPVQIRSREQALRVLMRQAVSAKGAEMLSPLTSLPEFELLTIDEAINFLAPYFKGKRLSKDTIFRHIQDGSIVATKLPRSRTGRRWILKASLVAWMARLGKQLQEEMMP